MLRKVGGKTGSRKKASLFFSSSRPGDSALEKIRKANRLFGSDETPSKASVASGGTRGGGTNSTTAAHVDLNDMPDSTGANTDHDERYRVYIDQVGGSGAGTTYGAITPAPDGIETEFTVDEGVYGSGKLEVNTRGQDRLQGTDPLEWSETVPASGTFTFVTAPYAGDPIKVRYTKA